MTLVYNDGEVSDGGHCAQQLSDPTKARERFARLHLPGVYIDDRGHLICLHPSRAVAEHLVLAAIHIILLADLGDPHGQ
jgi:hypothetical protein